MRPGVAYRAGICQTLDNNDDDFTDDTIVDSSIAVLRSFLSAK